MSVQLSMPLDSTAKEWERLVSSLSSMEQNAAATKAFGDALSQWRSLKTPVLKEHFTQLVGKRSRARALTWLWAEDQEIRERLLTIEHLSILVNAQKSRLSMLTLMQLIGLFFKEFSDLENLEFGLLDTLGETIRQQLSVLIRTKKSIKTDDLLGVLLKEGDWLLNKDGAHSFVSRVINKNIELVDEFKNLKFSGLENGVFGRICTSIYYIKTIKELQENEWDPVLDELTKQDVFNMPFKDNLRIGHEVVATLIDKIRTKPSKAWQKVIMDIAGDPRIYRSNDYLTWWQPLGQERVGKFKSWLAGRDIELFLKAFQQYSEEKRNEDALRMFAARKVFLEGLHSLEIIRDTRLMLGRRAKGYVGKLLKETSTKYIILTDSTLADTAIIYIDCGSFYLVEGSHNFQIWVYLKQPGNRLLSSSLTQISHSDLTRLLPNDYKREHGNLPYKSFTHHANTITWQKNVFDFLADNGVSLGSNIEKMLTPQDYREYLERFGLPIATTSHAFLANKPVVETKNAAFGEPNATTKYENFQLPIERRIIDYFSENPGRRAREASKDIELSRSTINHLLYGSLKSIFWQDENHGWHLKKED